MAGVANRGRGRPSMHAINMVPFLDVMPLLPLLFMVTAPLTTPSMLQLPSMGPAARPPARVIPVTAPTTEAPPPQNPDATP